MEWIRTDIYTTTEGIEPVSAVLLDTGITGIQVFDDNEVDKFITEASQYWDYVDEELLNRKKEPVMVTVYVSANPYGREQLAAVQQAIDRLKGLDIGVDLGSLELKLSENLNDEDWLNKWKEYYKPFNVGKKLLIKPVWEVAEGNGRIVFNINPGHIFGTGLHQTTQLCIEALEKYVNGGQVLDLGCGSGILSIISLLLGAKNAIAVDIDENAVKTAYENAELNGICKDRYTVLAGNILNNKKLQDTIGYNKYNVITANIIADVICAAAPIVKRQLMADGIFIASGIIKDRLEDVYAALKENGFEIINTAYKDEWVGVTAHMDGSGNFE